MELLLCASDSGYGYVTELRDCREKGKSQSATTGVWHLKKQSSVKKKKKIHFNSLVRERAALPGSPGTSSSFLRLRPCTHRSRRLAQRAGPLTSLFCCVCCHLHLRFRASFSTPRSISTYRDFRSIRSRSWKPHMPASKQKRKNQLSHSREDCTTRWGWRGGGDVWTSLFKKRSAKP